MPKRTVAVLFAREDSIYKTMQRCSVYDAKRDARTYRGGLPVVAHPPCRLWGRLRTFSNAPESEKELAHFAVAEVRRCGGVLEHPWRSTLWDVASLPPAGRFDEFGGWTLPVLQSWWGHRAAKATWLYIVGCSPADTPELPFVLGTPTHVISKSRCKWQNRPEVTKRERESTPVAFAKWLIDLAEKCTPEFTADSQMPVEKQLAGWSNSLQVTSDLRSGVDCE